MMDLFDIISGTKPSENQDITDLRSYAEMDSFSRDELDELDALVSDLASGIDDLDEPTLESIHELASQIGSNMDAKKLGSQWRTRRRVAELVIQARTHLYG